MTDKPRVWFDFENTPHVLFLEPILRYVLKHGADVLVTAKPQAQTLALAVHQGLSAKPIGAGDRRSLAGKVVGGLGRAWALRAWASGMRRPDLLISSSRTASLAAWSLGIPAVGLVDYEHARHGSIALACDVVWMPDLLRDAPLPRRTKRVGQYFPGLKENLYLDSWSYDRSKERSRIGVTADTLLVIARPPADGAHYGTGNADELFRLTLDAVLGEPRVRVVVLPRNARQMAKLQATLNLYDRLTVVGDTVAGPSLLAAADLIIGGGGTMNREAAVLGVPVWSLFDGPPPCIDEALCREGRLQWIRSREDAKRLTQRPLPGLREGRGPYPEGLAAILHDLNRRLKLSSTDEEL